MLIARVAIPPLFQDLFCVRLRVRQKNLLYLILKNVPILELCPYFVLFPELMSKNSYQNNNLKFCLVLLRALHEVGKKKLQPFFVYLLLNSCLGFCVTATKKNFKVAVLK